MNWKAEGGFSDSRYDHEGVVGEIKRKEGPCALSEVQHSHMSINLIRTCQTFSAFFRFCAHPHLNVKSLTEAKVNSER